MFLQCLPKSFLLREPSISSVEITNSISLLLIIVLIGTSISRSEDLQIIPSEDILEKIENGEPAYYRNVIILGDLNLKRQNPIPEYNISSPIEIYESKIHGNVNFDDARMQRLVNFENTEIFGVASFNRTQFIDEANFRNSEFDKDALFLGAVFKKDAIFKGALFNGSASFWDARFGGKFAEFARSQFRKEANFVDSQFDIAKLISFQESRFFDNALFGGARITGSSDFGGAQFEGLADFSFSRIDGSLDFVGSRFNKVIILNDMKFGSLIITWDSLKNKVICNGPMYLNLIRNFKDLEQFDDADNCYYDYRDWKRQERPLGWAKTLDYLALISCGYGVRWQNTFLLGIGIMILFGIYFSIKEGILNSREAGKIQMLERSIFFSLTLLLSAPTDWYINIFGNERYKDIVTSSKYSIFLERVIGWSLLILLVNTLSRVMIRY